MGQRQGNKSFSDSFNYVNNHSTEFFQDLKELCSYRSVPKDTVGMDSTVHWIVSKLKSLGVETKFLNDPRESPTIFGEIKGNSTKTILFYNYYDVVSEGNIDDWKAPPFQPTAYKGRFYARGADSNKGNLLSRIHAIETIIKGLSKNPPITIKFLIDGEEESGSPQLAEIFKEHQKILSCNYCIWAGERRDVKNRPQIALGAKGLLHLEFNLQANRNELHSSLATIVSNPAVELTSFLSSLIGRDGRCKLEGFMIQLKITQRWN